MFRCPLAGHRTASTSSAHLGLTLAAALALVGCAAGPRAAAAAGSPSSAAAPSAVAAPRRPSLASDARVLTYRLEVVDGDDRDLAPVARATMASAGYRIAPHEAPADATVRIARETVATGARGEEERLSVRLLLDGEEQGWWVGPIAPSSERESELAELVDRLTTSVALATVAQRYADRREAHRLAAAARLAPRVEATPEPPPSGALARRCLQQRSRAACAKLSGAERAPGAGPDEARAGRERGKIARADEPGR